LPFFVFVFVSDIRGRFVSVRSASVTWDGSSGQQTGSFSRKNSGDSPGKNSETSATVGFYKVLNIS